MQQSAPALNHGQGAQGAGGTSVNRAETMRRIGPALAGMGAFAVMAAIWLIAPHGLFYGIETQWGIWPGDYPFSDLEGVLSGIECQRSGINPYVANPCDTWHRQFDYPPAWLWLSVLPVTTGWLVPAGIALCLAFFASLTLLPPARSAMGARMVGAGVLSSVTLFAVERANNDLAVFILVAIGAALIARARLRADGPAGGGALPIAGYGAVYLAALLKYFPLAVMALALRERIAMLVALTLAALAATGLFVATHAQTLAEALGTIPFGSPFRMVYGAANLGGGLVMAGGAPSLGHAVTLVAVLAALVGGVAMGLRPAAARAIAPLNPAEQTFALAGALMVLGPFFTAQNIDYRAVHMLLMLPTLVVLRETGAPARYASLCWVALALLWMGFFRIKVLSLAYLFTGTAQHLIEAIPGFLLREALWWWLVVHSVALVTALLRDGPVFGWVAGKPGRAAWDQTA